MNNPSLIHRKILGNNVQNHYYSYNKFIYYAIVRLKKIIL